MTDDCVVRINQEELGYLEDEYEDLKALFQMFDFDQVHPPLLSRTKRGPEDLVGVGDEINSILTKSNKKN